MLCSVASFRAGSRLKSYVIFRGVCGASVARIGLERIAKGGMQTVAANICRSSMRRCCVYTNPTRKQPMIVTEFRRTGGRVIIWHEDVPPVGTQLVVSCTVAHQHTSVDPPRCQPSPSVLMPQLCSPSPSSGSMCGTLCSVQCRRMQAANLGAGSASTGS